MQRKALCQFSDAFRLMLAKSITYGDAKELRTKMVEAILMLEEYFPLSILDLMLHKLVHVCEQVRVSSWRVEIGLKNGDGVMAARHSLHISLHFTRPDDATNNACRSRFGGQSMCFGHFLSRGSIGFSRI